jgi:hypothetical protein
MTAVVIALTTTVLGAVALAAGTRTAQPVRVKLRSRR